MTRSINRGEMSVNDVSDPSSTLAFEGDSIGINKAKDNGPFWNEEQLRW
jgi:hypothetical protein